MADIADRSDRNISAHAQSGINAARAALPQGKSAERCEICTLSIPQARREALVGVKLCVECQAAMENAHG